MNANNTPDQDFSKNFWNLVIEERERGVKNIEASLKILLKEKPLDVEQIISAVKMLVSSKWYIENARLNLNKKGLKLLKFESMKNTKQFYKEHELEIRNEFHVPDSIPLTYN
jgi:hypothetical protein